MVFFDSFIPDMGNISFICQDSYQSGILSGKLMNIHLRKRGTIAIIRVIPDDYHINQRVKGFEYFYKDNSYFQLKTYDIYNSDDSEEFKAILDKIINENNDLEGIFVTNASTHHIAENIKPLSDKRKIHIIGYDLIDENILYLENGTIDFRISQRPEDQGYQSLYALYRHIVLKEKINNKIMMPIDIITKENINYYL